MTADYRLVMFDWDGTLMDSAGHIVDSMQRAMGDLGLEVLDADTIRNVIGLGMREAVNTLFPHDNSSAFVETFTAQYREYYFAPGAPQELFPGAEAMLRTLHGEGCLLAVATSKSRLGLDQSLRDTGLGELFHASRTADETASKPDPRMLKEILAHLNVAPGDSVMVGDTEYDLEMAKRAGVASVGVSFGAHARERLLGHGPLACLDELGQLPQVLGVTADTRVRA